MNYENFDVEDFIMDESFQQYCIGSDPEASRFWKQWLLHHPEKTEQINLAKTLYLNLNGNLDAQAFIRHHQAFSNALQVNGIPVNSQVKSGLVRPIISGLRWVGVAAAAVLGVVLITFWLNNNKDNADDLLTVNSTPTTTTASSLYTYISKPGEKKSFQLPDGSKVYLNAGSTLKLSEQFNKTNREMSLQGEAYFDVVHNPDLPFTIRTSDMDVMVLGTAFNVRAYPDDEVSETSLVRGSVEILVKGADARKLVLKPTEKIIIEKHFNNLPPSVVDAKKVGKENSRPRFVIAPLTHIPKDSAVVELSWIDNRLTFSDESFEDIAKRLERWYDINIVFESEELKDYRFTGTFDKETIQRVLEVMQLSRSFQYKFENDKHIIIR